MPGPYAAEPTPQPQPAQSPLTLILIVAVAFLLFQGKGCPQLPIPQPQPPDPPVPVVVIDRVTYVYEKDQGPVPPGVSAGLLALNADKARKILASEIDDDVRDADGQIPDQYAVALAKAAEVGTPVLVVQAGTTVVRTTKPTTLQEVLEAAK
jgi:hypothetical protein